MKLTPVQKQVLECCIEWSDPFEVAERRRSRGVAVYWHHTEQQLIALRERGLIEYGETGQYRTTFAGRSILDGGRDGE